MRAGLRAQPLRGQAGEYRRAPALRHRSSVRQRGAAVHAGGGEREARGGGGGRAGRARLCASPGDARSRRDGVRGEREARRAERIRRRRLQGGGRFRAARGGIRAVARRDRGAMRENARPRRDAHAAAQGLRCRLFGHGAGRRECLADRGRGHAGSRGRRRLYRAAAPGQGQIQAAGRAPDRGDRRRQHRHRHRRAEQAAGGGGRDHRLSPRPGTDECHRP